MPARWFRAVTYGLSALACAGIVGCASTGGRAPVEDRSTGAGRPTPPAAGAPASGANAVAVPPTPAVPRLNAENAGKPGFYTVRPGDTLARIALDHGQNWRDVARWNAIDNPNVIEVGQVLRVITPGTEAAAVAQPVATGSRIESRPLETRPSAMDSAGAAPAPAPAPAPAAAAAPAPGPTAASAAGGAVAREGDEDVNWLWPAGGPVLANFDEARNVKGLAIGGKLGDAVLAAADGRVVYAGSGLRGYGNLVIVKHNNTFLTAYAHNQTLLVREDQVVRRGQKIAEMGSSDSDRVQLHFEIRRMGKPVDPSRLLPAR
ncbi:MAG: peptidoglycan DD-metalloendopeptidase family protein [Rubrivivax sp.]|nr:peptidoglycan DD-metalloendopeptidase family protein [Rubrivivax sp.]